MKNQKQWWKFILLGVLAIILVGVWGLLWLTSLDRRIKERLSGQRWGAPTEYYSAPEKIIKGQKNISAILDQTLSRLEFTRVLIEREIIQGEYAVLSPDLCQKNLPEVPAGTKKCWIWAPHKNPWAQSVNPGPVKQLVAVGEFDQVIQVFETTEKSSPLKEAQIIELEPELFAQFYGGQPVLRKIVPLSDVPTTFLNAIMAIEDSQFLSHSGVSWTGMLRAAARNLLHGGVKEGGSTITQQLVKNYFLTQKRTFKRKITEIAMALLLESQFSKDDILETYINEVYLGQAGPFEIHGVGIAAKFFFNKQPQDLTLGEAAWLAGSIRGPQIYSPLSHPEKALKRREQVLKRMLELSLITDSELAQAAQTPLPKEPQRLLRDQAPFFIESVKYQLSKLELKETEGLRIYTTLNLRAQQAATQAVTAGLTGLEKKYAALQKKEAKYNAKLQGALIAADPTNGFVEAVVGGRSFSETQLNRAVNSKRQVGSVFKPFVFLTAFSDTEIKSEAGQPYTPLTLMQDEPFTVEYDKQSWSPKNYDDLYMGQIPLYLALEKSLNAATSRLALQAGLKKVAEVAAQMGIDSPLLAVPSLALGSATLSPYEVLQAYATLSRKGELNSLTFIYRILNVNSEVIWEHHLSPIQAVDAVGARQTISLMEGALDRGTGRFAREAGFTHPAAGKTGTTSDTKDSWFAGFTPLHAAVVWVGFDQPQPTGLTGAMAALPIWTEYMKAFAATRPEMPFSNPDGASELIFDPRCALEAPPQYDPKKDLSLVFRKGLEPQSQCWTQKVSY